MDGDAYRDMTHYEMQQLVWRAVTPIADYADIEHRLPNRKIADVFYRAGPISVIIEIKTQIKQSLIESAYHKYKSYCDYLVIAGPEQPVYGDGPTLMGSWESLSVMRIGIWWVSWQGITEYRPAHRLSLR